MSDNGLNILILNPDLPVFPGRAGHEHLHTTHLARRAGRVGLASLVHTPEQMQKKQTLSDAGVALYLWESPQASQPPSKNGQSPSRGPWRQRMLMSLYRVAQAMHFRPPDTLIQDLQFCNLAPALSDALDQQRWQAMVVVQSSCARWLDYLPKFPVSVLVLHDIRALMLQRKAAATANPLAKFLGHLNAWRCGHFEKQYCRKFDLVVTMSKDDENWVRQNYAPARVTAVPIPVDGEYFTPMNRADCRPPRMVFTGMMSHPPNADAARFFALEVLPKIRDQIPDAEFWIVGREPPPAVAELAAVPGVIVTGFVPDIRPFMAGAAVIVVPLRFGSGMRNKILEAWGMEKCVVSTTIGAEGLDYHDGQDIYIADDAAKLAERTVAVLRDDACRRRVGGEGIRQVREAHQPQRLAEHYYSSIAAVWREKQAAAEPMRAVIDLRWMTPGVAGGIENLSRSFIGELGQVDAVNHYTLLVPSEVRYDFDVRASHNMRVIAGDGLRSYVQPAIGVFRRLTTQWLNLPDAWSGAAQTLRSAAKMNAQVALSVSGYIKPDLYPLRNVLIVHDLQHEYLPHLFAPAVLEERQRVFRESIAKAAFILAMSEHTRKTVMEKHGVAPDRIQTVCQACDPIFHRAHPDAGAVAKKYGLGDARYLIFPANTWPHKNHKIALEALARLRDEHKLTPLLVCTGARKEAQSTLGELIGKLKLENQVRFLGYCPVEDMPALYERAAAMVYPSLFEGFGIPLLEAMWCRCPIVCSNTTSLPEVAGDAAIQVDPTDSDAVAAGVYRVLTDGALRDELIARGQKRARQFSWTSFVIQTVQAMRNVWIN